MSGKRKEKEEVVDNSRQRLHGAFQGGFSAGYYNTVGSKEGWQPKDYQNKQQSITDFMDEEDIQEFGIDLIQEDFSSLGSTQKEVEKRTLKLEVDDVKIVIKKNIWNNVFNSIHNPFKNKFDRLASNTFGRGYDQFKDAPEFKQHSKEVKAENVEKKNQGFGTGIFEYEEEYGDLDDYSAPTNYNTVIYDEDEDFVKPKVIVKKTRGEVKGFIERSVKRVPKKHVQVPYPPKEFKPNPIFADKFTDNSIRSFIELKKQERMKEVVQVQVKDPIVIYQVPTKYAEMALQGFMPFQNDPAKQNRYKQFLEKIINNSKKEEIDKEDEVGKVVEEERLSKVDDVVKSVGEEKMSKEDESNESREFSKAAMLYRPLAQMISTRFANEGSIPSIPAPKKIKYGHLTRKTRKWIPNKTLCRRFGVRYKESDDIDEEVEEDKEMLNKDTMRELMLERDRLIEDGELGMVETDILTKEVMMVGFKDIVEDVVEVEVEKPSMELFRAIFADSGSDSEDEIVDKPDTIISIDKWAPEKPPEVEIAEEEVLMFKKPTKSKPKKAIIVEEEEEDQMLVFKHNPKERPNKGDIEKIPEEEFRPVFKKPTAIKSGLLNKPRVKKRVISSMAVDDADGPVKEEVKVKRVRPSASDYM